ncbi:MAG: MarR family transcriptional regulator [Solirubrobacteraceae bacterium]|nr:MarR family transcriptional regulator [Patulibacter sp.]
MAEDPAAADVDGDADRARAIWLQLTDLVLDHQRRRQVAEATGVSFARTRAIRRLARRPMSMRELADALGTDPPNVTGIVDDLESQGLVRRGPHPTDRRAKIVDLTAKGRRLAAKADDILAIPPPGVAALPPEDFDALEAILRRARGDH